jgi:Tol biopolymer transport system component
MQRFIVQLAAPLLMICAAILVATMLVAQLTQTDYGTAVALHNRGMPPAYIVVLDVDRSLYAYLDFQPDTMSILPDGRNIRLTSTSADGVAQVAYYNLLSGQTVPVFASDTPLVSPDGTVMVFRVKDVDVSGSHKSGLYRGDLMTGDVIRLFDGPVRVYDTWSDDNRTAFTAGNTLYVTGPDARDPQPVPITTDAAPAEPYLSPDGAWLSFITYNLSLPPALRNLHVVRRDGTEQRLLTGDVVRISGRRWSPDSSRFMFIAGPLYDLRLTMLQIDTGAMTNLTTPEYYYPFSFAEPVTWSPDSSRFVMFMFADDMLSSAIAIYDRDGQYGSIIHNNANRTVWSPDSRYLVVRDRGNNEGFDPMIVVVIDTGDSLYSYAEMLRLENATEPEWTASGDLILIRYGPTGRRLYRLDPITGQGSYITPPNVFINTFAIAQR